MEPGTKSSSQKIKFGELRNIFIIQFIIWHQKKMQIKVNLIWNFTPNRKSKLKKKTNITATNDGEEVGKKAA